MKKIKIISIAILLILFISNSYCCAFSFEFNSNTYTIDYDIPKFEKEWTGTDGSIPYLNYLLIYNCSSNTFNLLCFDIENVLVERIGEKIKFLDNNSTTVRFFIFTLSNNSWEYSSNPTRFSFPSALGEQVFLFKSKGVTIDSSVYDIAGDGSVTLDFILKNTEITENG